MFLWSYRHITISMDSLSSRSCGRPPKSYVTVQLDLIKLLKTYINWLVHHGELLRIGYPPATQQTLPKNHFSPRLCKSWRNMTISIWIQIHLSKERKKRNSARDIRSWIPYKTSFRLRFHHFKPHRDMRFRISKRWCRVSGDWCKRCLIVLRQVDLVSSYGYWVNTLVN